ncbi:hypothetical protein NUU61_007519 [Penicillium alfredii]|uniref:Uncharacterized protein n=1 Tax=Penicillium alfredii TaxID=1506179 RepID=A0A9W9F312_9EURO|nr:uncharacterized protein NUU61_007519 [Penicillium alfredii]KAJ5092649.1 hypothetical protein NUU61_007519 [Penicillium alfredii]
MLGQGNDRRTHSRTSAVLGHSARSDKTIQVAAPPTARCTGTRLDMGLGRVSWPPAVNLYNYQTCRKHGAQFILLPHDIWGTDHVNSSTAWPGDNGDWSDYEFLAHPDG